MAGTSKPRLSNCALASSAAPSAPTTMGTMALWGLSPLAAPKASTRSHSVARSCGGEGDSAGVTGDGRWAGRAMEVNYAVRCAPPLPSLLALGSFVSCPACTPCVHPVPMLMLRA